MVVVGEGREGRGGWRREGGGGDGSVGAGLRREGLQRERREIMGEKEGEPVVCRGTAERRSRLRPYSQQGNAQSH